MIDTAVWGTDGFKFGLFMLSFGLLIGGMIGYGVRNYMFSRRVDELLQDRRVHP